MLETQELKKFSVDSWYPIFKDVAIKTFIFKIPEELLNNLETGNCDTNIEEICTLEYVNQIKNALHILKNEAFVKNNWHAPIDAKFISFGNFLKVTNIKDLILYLSASDLIIEDFVHKDIGFCIALRPWLNIHPASEFRCIVVNNVLRAITPRDWPAYYAHFSEEAPNIIHKISEFYTNYIKLKFPTNHYTFDVILNNDGEPTLLDFGQINSKTKLYAFKWDEIHQIMKKHCAEEVPPVFRFLESDIGIFASIAR